MFCDVMGIYSQPWLSGGMKRQTVIFHCLLYIVYNEGIEHAKDYSLSKILGLGRGQSMVGGD
jgi:hypothetical protein